MRGVTRRILTTLRDAWLILGLAIALFLVLEAVYRVQGAARGSLPAEIPVVPQRADPHHPNAREPWWGEATADANRLRRERFRYDPFRGWWAREWRSRYLNVDADGRRVTVPPFLEPGPRRLVYMFGGSAMWGWIVRDSFTIPSLVASRLRELGYADVEVVNLAQSTFNLAQNAATLLKEIRDGRMPAVAVFLDGNNEVAPVFQYGEPGHILNDALIARRFERQTDLRSDVVTLLQHSALVQRLLRREAPEPGPERLRLCDAVAGSYARQVRALGAVAAAFRFDPIFLWQPMRATTNKPLTPWEREMRSDEVWRGMIRRCTAAVDAALASQPEVPYYPLHSLFDRDPANVFTDDYGHMTERANGVVADYIAARIAERLGPPSATRRRPAAR